MKLKDLKKAIDRRFWFCLFQVPKAFLYCSGLYHIVYFLFQTDSSYLALTLPAGLAILLFDMWLSIIQTLDND